MKRLYISFMLCVAAMCAWAQVPMPEWTKQLVGAESAPAWNAAYKKYVGSLRDFDNPYYASCTFNRSRMCGYGKCCVTACC